MRVFKLLLDNYTLWIKAVEDRDTQGQQAIVKRIQALQNQEDIPYIINDVDDLMSESIEGITRVKEIVQELKCFARTDEIEIAENNVNEIIEVALKLVWNELKYKCHVEKKLSDLPEILCDAGHLKQVFVNLLVNASQAIKKHGTMTIETKVINTHVFVEIADTGEGISKEHLSLIFEPFFTTKPVGEGTGLGLAISYDIVQNHGGAIEVESELGQGTQFKIMLPIKKKVMFSLAAPQASRVALWGSFNNWTKNIGLMRQDDNGAWKTELQLEPGIYDYRFLVDGEWHEESHSRLVLTPFGIQNSLQLNPA